MTADTVLSPSADPQGDSAPLGAERHDFNFQGGDPFLDSLQAIVQRLLHHGTTLASSIELSQEAEIAL